MGLLDAAIIACLPLLPLPLMRALSARYIAGERLDQATARLAKLREQGYRGILDILGEDVESDVEAREVLEEYMAAAHALSEQSFDAYISVKPTHLGLRISEELATELYRELTRRCDELGIFVRVEMEDHSTTDATLRIFERLRAEASNVGIVLQSRLFRTPDDIDALGAGPLSVRMVKGIYLEPSEVAHVDSESIRRAFVSCTEKLFDRGAFVSLATHDDVMANDLLALVRAKNLGVDRYEFQVLLGVRSRLWREWLDGGHSVRVYVPFGPQWRAYSTRRLRKNPQILRHVMRDTFSFGRR